MLAERIDQQALEAADVGDHIDGLGQSHDRIADELTRAVPGDLAAAVDIDHRSAVGRPLVRLGALARRVDGLVLEQDQRVGPLARDDVGVDPTLQRPAVVVGHERGCEAGGDDLEHGDSFACGDLWIASNNTPNLG